MARKAKMKHCAAARIAEEREGESPTFDEIGNTCLIWDDRALSLLDPSMMTKIGKSAAHVCQGPKWMFEADLSRVFAGWFFHKKALLDSYPRIDLLREMDQAIGKPIKQVLNRHDEEAMYRAIHDRLVILRDTYNQNELNERAVVRARQQGARRRYAV